MSREDLSGAFPTSTILIHTKLHEATVPDALVIVK